MGLGIKPTWVQILALLLTAVDRSILALLSFWLFVCLLLIYLFIDWLTFSAVSRGFPGWLQMPRPQEIFPPWLLSSWDHGYTFLYMFYNTNFNSLWSLCCSSCITLTHYSLAYFPYPSLPPSLPTSGNHYFIFSFFSDSMCWVTWHLSLSDWLISLDMMSVPQFQPCCWK